MACTNRVAVASTLGAAGLPDRSKAVRYCRGLLSKRSGKVCCCARPRGTLGQGYMIMYGKTRNGATRICISWIVPGRSLRTGYRFVSYVQRQRGSPLASVPPRNIEVPLEVPGCPQHVPCRGGVHYRQGGSLMPYTMQRPAPRIDIAVNTPPLIYHRKARCGGRGRQNVA